MKNFLEEMEKNPELKAKMEELDKNPASTPKDFIEVAAEYGVELKEEDFKPASAQGELDDDELDAVAGGGDCWCVLGGGGSEDSHHKTCGCAFAGGGVGKDGNFGCMCPLEGIGA